MGSLQLIASFVIVDGIYILVDGLGRASDAGEPCDVVRDPCGRIVEEISLLLSTHVGLCAMSEY